LFGLEFASIITLPPGIINDIFGAGEGSQISQYSTTTITHIMKQTYCTVPILFFVLLAATTETTTDAFAPLPRRRQQISGKVTRSFPLSSTRPYSKPIFVLFNQKDDDDTLREAEDDAAVDAHDCPDPAMEAAAEERALMMAENMHLKVKQEIHVEETKEAASKEPHFDGHKATDKEMKQAEEDAAMDGHDCSDAGMETAAEERAVMMAYEMAEKMKKQKRKE
jgi:hypothetical protein